MNSKDKEGKPDKQRDAQATRQPGYQKEQAGTSRQSESAAGSRQSERPEQSRDKQDKMSNKDKPLKP